MSARMVVFERERERGYIEREVDKKRTSLPQIPFYHMLFRLVDFPPFAKRQPKKIYRENVPMQRATAPPPSDYYLMSNIRHLTNEP
jgi:hypothetical protein